jgi:hypothetical protein
VIASLAMVVEVVSIQVARLGRRDGAVSRGHVAEERLPEVVGDHDAVVPHGGIEVHARIRDRLGGVGIQHVDGQMPRVRYRALPVDVRGEGDGTRLQRRVPGNGHLHDLVEGEVRDGIAYPADRRVDREHGGGPAGGRARRCEDHAGRVAHGAARVLDSDRIVWKVAGPLDPLVRDGERLVPQIRGSGGPRGVDQGTEHRRGDDQDDAGCEDDLDDGESRLRVPETSKHARSVHHDP